MEKKKTLAVRIDNMTYYLSSGENDKYIQDIAEKADSLIKKIRSDNISLNSLHITVLALINALDQKQKVEHAQSQIKENTVDFQSRYDDLNTEYLGLRETCWELKKELLYHKNLCEVYEERLDELRQITPLDKPILKSNQKKDLKPLDKLQTSFAEIDQKADK